MLRFIEQLPMPLWAADAEAARPLAGAVDNDPVQ